ncbi:MAG: urea ABC transporter permease subunit UrtC [Burkholderiaceae bacterium]
MKHFQLSSEPVAHIALAILLIVLLPLSLDSFWLANFGKYIAFAFVAVGVVLVWGYCGILSLGQGIFFGIGGYAMAMFLKLEASAPELPDFMVWSSVETLPLWWEPFRSFTATVAAILLVPIAIAFPFAYAIFKKRVSGVYFAIVTISLAMTMTVLIIGQQGDTGGANGITDFRTLLGMDVISEDSRRSIYFIEIGLLLVVTTLAGLLLQTRFGKILIAVRDREDRVRFSGYNTAMFKAFVFTIAAILSSIGGAMYTLQVGLVSPTLVGSVASVEMVIFAAMGGRLSVTGAVIGALMVGLMKSYFSEQFPQTWLFLLGAMFIIVVGFMPNGIAGAMQNILSSKSVKKELP